MVDRKSHACRRKRRSHKRRRSFCQLPANELAGMMLASMRGLRLRKKSGHDGQVDCHPCSYVSSCDVVSRARETTADTIKLISSRSV